MKNNSVKSDKYSFAVIRNRGTVNNAVTMDGANVRREERIILESYRDAFPEGIPCASYDNHFVYLDPSKKIGRWRIMCTCGSPAVITGYDAYKNSASPQGALIICMSHAQTGRHNDGSQ